MHHEHILIVEDEPDIRQVLAHNLERAGFQVSTAANGEDGLQLARRQALHLIVLDLMLPGIGGLDVCRLLRRDPRTAAIPVLMLSAMVDESDIVAGLEIGADDYVTKPFSPREVVARVRALVRRREAQNDDQAPLTAHGLAIHPGRHEVTLGGERLELTPAEFRLLHTLARRPGWVFSRDQIVQAVRGEDYHVTERSVDVQVFGLRRKLGEAQACIETVRGVGYRFRE